MHSATARFICCTSVDLMPKNKWRHKQVIAYYMWGRYLPHTTKTIQWRLLYKSYSRRTLDLLLPKQHNACLNKVLLFGFFLHLTSPSNAYIIYPCPKVLYMHVHYAGANEWLTSTHSEAHLFAMLEEASRSHNTTAHASVGSTKNFLPLWNMSSNKSFV